MEAIAANCTYPLKIIPKKYVTLELVKIGLKNERHYLSDVPKDYLSKELCIYAYIHHPFRTMEVIPDEFKTPDFYAEVIKHGEFYPKDIPNEYLTEEALIQYVSSKKCYGLDDIPDPWKTTPAVMKAFSDYHIDRYIYPDEEHCERACERAEKIEKRSLEYILSKCEIQPSKYVWDVICNSRTGIHAIKNPTREMWRASIQEFPENILEAPEWFLQTDSLTIVSTSAKHIDEKKKIEKIFQDKLKYLVESFVNGSKDYDNTIEEINRYSNIKEFENSIKSAKDDIENVKSSKDSFVEGQKYEKDENILEAIKSYSKVIELDKNNYKVAQDYIKNNKENLKDKTLAEVDSLISNNDYVTANQKIKDLQDVISNDTEITEKSNQIKDKAKEQEIEKYKNEQEVTVESAKILVQDDRYKSLYPDMIEVVIKNNSNKTIKDYNVAVLAYDNNNYPLKIKPQFNYNGGGFEFTGQADNVNVVAGATGGKNYGWKLDSAHGISKVIAIVKDVTYYDGTTWDNPYYTYWIEQYKEKPLQ